MPKGDTQEPFGHYVFVIFMSSEQAIPSKLPRLFLGVSHQQRRKLAKKMLEQGRTGHDLERAIRFAVGRDGQSARRRLTMNFGHLTRAVGQDLLQNLEV